METTPGTSTPSTDALLPYLPNWQRSRLARASDSAPESERTRGALLFADVSGFTELSEQFARNGALGAELLTEVLNAVYGEMIDAVLARGGDVWTFAGDAVFAVWRVEEHGDLEAAAARAASAGLDMQRRMAELAEAQVYGLKIRVSVSVGALEVHELGAPGSPQFSILSGGAIAAVVEADALCEPGEVLLTPRAMALVSRGFSGVPIEREFVRIEVQTTDLAPHTPRQPPAVELAQLLRYLPAVVPARLGSGQAEFLGEFRTLSVLFVSIAPVDAAFDLARCRAAAATIQQLVDKYEGAVDQFIHDDKGTVCLLSFGLPQYAHDDDSVRAVEASLSLHTALADQGISCAIGVATGRVFCGTYGHPLRHRYSVVGSTINLAARLMQECDADGVLCDWYTRRSAARLAGFDELGARRLKGFAEPVRVFTPVGRMKQESRVQLVGRDGELQVIVARTRALAAGGAGALVWVQGPAGIGKSSLLGRAAHAARDLGLPVLLGAAHSIDVGVPLFALQEVVRGWLGSPADAAAAYAAVKRDPAVRELLPLLSPMLDFAIDDTEHTHQMNGTLRAGNTLRALTALARMAARAPCVVMLEDAHWMDSATLGWLNDMQREGLPILWVVSSRPLAGPGPAWRALDGAADDRLSLSVLGPADIEQLVRNRLGVESVPAPVVELVRRKAEGNPFYAEELTVSLVEHGLIRVQQGEVVVAGSLEQAELPDTLQGLITSRIDRLEPAVQLTLKVAAVVGRAFEDAVVSLARPDGQARDVSVQLQAAGRLELVAPVEQIENRTTWSFRHAVIHQTTYELLLFAQRKELHRSVAVALEALHAEDRPVVAARLAHHWDRADAPASAVRAYALAGRQALESHASEEAVGFFDRALQMAEVLPEIGATDRAEWLRARGDAHYAMTRHPDANADYEAALAVLGHARPGAIFAFAFEVGRNLMGRWLWRTKGRNEAERRSARIALKAAEDLGPVYVHAQQRLKLAHLAFKAANLADLAGITGESAYAVCQLGYILALSGMPRVGERDLLRGQELARMSGDAVHQVMCDVFVGMFHNLSGRASEAVLSLTIAVEVVDDLTADLWQYRSRLFLAEALLCVGDLERSEVVFDEAAAMAERMERDAVGVTTAFGTVATLRRGDIEGAVARIDGPRGARRTRPDVPQFMRFSTLGVAAEVYARAGLLQRARAAAEECARMAAGAQRLDGWFSVMHAHAGCVEAWLILAASDPAALAHARTAHRRYGKLTRMFPGCQPSHALLAGKIHQASGSLSRALDAYRKAHALALSMELPYEQRCAAEAAARLGDAGLAGEAGLTGM